MTRRGGRRLALWLWLVALALVSKAAAAADVAYRPLEEILLPEVRVFSARVVDVREPHREGELRREIRIDDAKAIRGEIAEGLRAVDYTEVIPNGARSAQAGGSGGAARVVLPGSGHEREIRAGQRWIFFTSANTRAATWSVMRAEPAAREKYVYTSISRLLGDAGPPPPLVHRVPPRPDAGLAPIAEAGAAGAASTGPPTVPAPGEVTGGAPQKKGCAGCSFALVAAALASRRPRRRAR